MDFWLVKSNYVTPLYPQVGVEVQIPKWGWGQDNQGIYVNVIYTDYRVSGMITLGREQAMPAWKISLSATDLIQMGQILKILRHKHT